MSSSGDKPLKSLLKFAGMEEWKDLLGVFNQFYIEGIKSSIELNKSLTELSTVYMKGQNDIQQYVSKLSELGMATGTTTTEIAKGAVELARQGLNEEQMFNQLEAAVKYAAINNLDFSTSTKTLSDAVSSMNVDLERASDVFSYLGDATAAGADDIGKAIQTVGETARSAGIEFEKVSSWIATLSSNTQESADDIGKSIRSIIERMQSFKETGVNSEDSTTINDVVKALAEIGVGFENEGGNVRNFGVILDEIGLKWDSITSKQQAYIASTLAGSNQSAEFVSLMQNYGQSVDLYKGSLDSAGISTEKFGLYQQGTQAHINTMKAALEGLWSSMFKSEDIRNVIDLMTGLFTTLSQVANTFGGLQTSVGAATAAFLLFNRATFTTQVDRLFHSLATAGLHMRSLSIFSELYTRSAVTAKLATIGLQTVLSVGFVAVISLATVGISKLIAAHQQAKEEQKAFAEQQQHIANSWSTHSTKIEALASEYERLNKITQNGSVFADVEQENNYRQIVEELATLMPNLVESIDDKGNKHLKNADAIQKEFEYAEKLATLNQNQTVLDAESTFKEKIDDIEKYQDQISNLQARMAMGGTVNGMTFIPFNESQLNQMEIEMLTLQQKIATSSNDMRSNLNTVVNSILSINNVKMDDGLSQQIDKITSKLNLEGLSPEEITNKANVIASLATKLNNLQISSDDSVIERTKEDIKRLGTELGLTDNRIDLFIASILDAKEAVKQSSVVFEPVIQRSKDVEQVTAELSDVFKKTADDISPLNAAIQKLEEGKSLTADEIVNLMQKVDGFSEAVTNENGVLVVNKDIVKGLREDSIKSFGDILKAKEEQVNGIEKQTYKELESYGIQIDGIKNVAEAMQALATAKQEVDRDIRTLMRDPELSKDSKGQEFLGGLQHKKAVIVEGRNTLQSIEEVRGQLDELKGKADPLLRAVGTTADANDKLTGSNNKLNGSNNTLINSSNTLINSNDKLNDSYTETVEVLTELQKKLDDVHKRQDQEEYNRRRMRKSSKEYQESLKKSIELKKEEIGLLEQGGKDPSQLVPNKVITTVKSTSGNSTFSNSTSSNGKYSDLINKYAMKYGVDPNLIAAIIQQESGFNNNSTSKAGAQGLMQLMPGTAKDLGVKNSYDPEQNISGGTKHFARLVKKYKGDVELALYAFNAGEGNVDKWIKNGKINNIPFKETREYAPKVLAHYQKFNNGTALIPASSSGTDSSNIVPKTPEEIKNADSKRVQDLNNANNQLSDLQILFLESIKYNADNAVEEQERLIAASKKRQEALDPTSAEYTQENKYQVNKKTEIQRIRNEESLELQKKLKEYGVESDEWDKIIKQLQTERSDLQSDKHKTLVENLNIGIEASKEHISEMDNLIQQSQNKMAEYAKGTPEYNKELNYQIELKKKQKKETDELIVSIENLLKSENLNAKDKKEFKAILDDLKLKNHTADIKELNEALIQSKGLSLEKAISDSSEKIDLSKRKMDLLTEGTSKYNQELYNQIAFTKEQIQANEKLIEYVQIQMRNEELSVEAREGYKEQLKGLVLANYDYNKSIKDLTKSLIELSNTKLSSIFDTIKNSLGKNSLFDVSEFNGSIDSIIAKLDEVDEKFLTNANFIDTTASTRLNLSDYASKIKDIAGQVKTAVQYYKDLNNADFNNLTSLTNQINNQVSLVSSLKSKLEEINNTVRDTELQYSKEEAALSEYIKTREKYYDAQIEAQQTILNNLDKQTEKEDRLKAIQEINDNLTKAKNDKRFSFITETGEEILTYDKARVEELEKQKDDLVKQYEREDVKKAIQAEIDNLQKAKQSEIDILNENLNKTKAIHQAELEALKLYQSSVSSLYDQAVSDTQAKLEQLQAAIQKGLIDGTLTAAEATNLLESVVGNWQTQSLGNWDIYIKQVSDKLVELKELYADMAAVVAKAMSMPNNSENNTGNTGWVDPGWHGDKSVPPTTSDKLEEIRNNIKDKYWDGKQWVTKYHTGGTAGQEPLASNEIPAILKIGEDVLTKGHKDRLKRIISVPIDFINNMAKNIHNSISTINRGTWTPAIEGGTNYSFSGPITVKANNPMEFLKGMDRHINSNRI